MTRLACAGAWLAGSGDGVDSERMLSEAHRDSERLGETRRDSERLDASVSEEAARSRGVAVC